MTDFKFNNNHFHYFKIGYEYFLLKMLDQEMKKHQKNESKKLEEKRKKTEI